jgi:hypothetical protein
VGLAALVLRRIRLGALQQAQDKTQAAFIITRAVAVAALGIQASAVELVD